MERIFKPNFEFNLKDKKCISAANFVRTHCCRVERHERTNHHLDSEFIYYYCVEKTIFKSLYTRLLNFSLEKSETKIKAKLLGKLI